VTADVRAAVDVAWRTILNREPRPEADFFRSGGDSLLLVRFVTHLRNAGIGAQPVDVLKGRTFDRITGLVAQRATVPSGGSAAAQETRPAPVPLLPAQARWLGNRFTEPDQFSLGGVFHLPEAPADLSGAFAALVDRHEALRTRYVLDGNGGATAEVLPSLPEDPVVTADVTDAEVPEVLKSAHKRHDLAAGKVLAATWLPAQRLLHIALHHLTLDGRTRAPAQYEHHLARSRSPGHGRADRFGRGTGHRRGSPDDGRRVPCDRALVRKPPYGRRAGPWLERVEKVLRAAAARVAEGEIDDAVMLRQQIVADSYADASRYGEKYNEYLLELDLLSKTMPDAHWVLLVRHPVAVADSMARWAGDRPWRPRDRAAGIGKWVAWHTGALRHPWITDSTRCTVQEYSRLCAGGGPFPAVGRDRSGSGALRDGSRRAAR
jgi:hypothetical protein